MIVKWEDGEPGSFSLRDSVETCRLSKFEEGARAEIVLRNGDDVTVISRGSIFVMNDRGDTIDKIVVRH